MAEVAEKNMSSGDVLSKRRTQRNHAEFQQVIRALKFEAANIILQRTYLLSIIPDNAIRMA